MEETTIVVGNLVIWLGIAEIKELVDKEGGLSIGTIQTM